MIGRGFFAWRRNEINAEHLRVVIVHRHPDLQIVPVCFAVVSRRNMAQYGGE